jgi:FKBP-type peptidyl-prolyl cis-trans isomerase (trigger factor)
MYLIEAIGDKEELRVGQEELGEELRAIAARNRAKPEEVREYYVRNGLLNQLALELLERKVRAFLREHAKLLPAAS